MCPTTAAMAAAIIQRGAVLAMRPAAGDQHRRIAFRGIEEKRQHARREPGVARHVRRADISAASLADVVAVAAACTIRYPNGIEPRQIGDHDND